MKKGIVAGCVIIVILGVVIVPRIMNKEQFAEAAKEPIVEVTTPGKGSISLSSGLVGTIEPESVVYVYPKEAGDVTEVMVKAGEIVEAGQLLCVIDTKQLESAESSMESARLALRQADDELSRQSVLYSGGGISEQAYEQYRYNVQLAQITYDNAKTNYENQESYSRITAPISGVIEVCNAEAFDTVSPSDLICVISGQGAKVVSFSATERIKKNLREGDAVMIEKDGETYSGTIYEISSMADSETGLFKVKARLNENGGGEELSTGSMLKLYVTSDYVENTMTVPVDSVYYDGGLAYVYIYEEGVIHKVQVEVGLNDAENIEVKSGLQGTELVLTTWDSELFEGSHARLKETQAQ